MTEYHPTYKARTFNRLVWDQGIPGRTVPISLNYIHYNSHHISRQTAASKMFYITYYCATELLALESDKFYCLCGIMRY